MRISGLGPQIPENQNNQGVPARLMGILTLSENGEMLLRTQSGDALPVRLLGADLPLGQELNFSVVGKEENSLILSVMDNKPQVDRWESLLQGWGINNSKSWRGLVQDLFKENLPITKENLQALDRSVRMVRQEMGFEVKPQVLAFMLSRGIPVRPQTILAVLYRLYPEMRQRIATALEEFKPQEIMLGTPETIERSLQEVLSQPKPATDNGMAWQAALGSVVYTAGERGEIHWPSKEADEEETESRYGKRFGFDLLPPHLGLVEVRVDWSEEGSRITFILDSKHLERFQQEIPAWQADLGERGIHITAFAKAAVEESAELPPMVDRRI